MACGHSAARPDISPDAPGPAAGLFKPEVIYTAGSSDADVAIADIDGDGKPDLLVPQYGPGAVVMLSGVGDGTFANITTFPAGEYSSAIATGDFDGDGNVDFAVTSTQAAVWIYLGMGGGQVASSSISAGGWNWGIAAADLSGNGRSDLALATAFPSKPGLLMNNGSGGFVNPTTAYGGDMTWPIAVATGDLNGDGRVDVVVLSQGPLDGDSNVYVLLNNGNGGLAAPVGYEVGTMPQAVAVADFNGDGRLDLAVANEFGSASGSVSVLLGAGDGTFGPQHQYPVPISSVAAADLDGDGRADLVVATSEEIDVALGQADGTLSAMTSYPCVCGRVGIADLNGDGLPDLVGVSVDLTGLGMNAGGPRGIHVLLHAP